jgi:hypothetical protein
LSRLAHLRRVAFAAVALAVTVATSRPARADVDTYKRHMDNGVKLYTDKNYAAAIAEFQAAYEAKPNANPLVDIALCDKEMFRYPQAIAALVKALGRHGDTMDATDKKAAEDAIKEMRALLGKVTVSVTPPGATLVVDGEDAPATEPVMLGPGKHTIVARAEGYASAQQNITVVSGGEQKITFALVAEKGSVTIDAPDARTSIAIDDQPVGHGHWTGLLAPGRHVVRLMSPDDPPYSMEIVVAAGVPLTVSKGVGGVPIVAPKQEEPPRRGFYVFGLGSMLFAATHPPDFPGSTYGGTVNKPDYGAGYGVRVGFQVNKVAGFDAMFEHSSIFTYAASNGPSPDTPYYRIIANRFAVALRLISVGDTVRFVGTLGGGFTYDDMTVVFPAGPCPAGGNGTAPCYLVGPDKTGDHAGFDAFALMEAAMELDLDRVLLDFGAEAQLQSTGGLVGVGNRGLFASLPLINGGPAIRVGYRFW